MRAGTHTRHVTSDQSVSIIIQTIRARACILYIHRPDTYTVLQAYRPMLVCRQEYVVDYWCLYSMCVCMGVCGLLLMPILYVCVHGCIWATIDAYTLYVCAWVHVVYYWCLYFMCVCMGACGLLLMPILGAYMHGCMWSTIDAYTLCVYMHGWIWSTIDAYTICVCMHGCIWSTIDA